jgi:hypothetical protein
MTEASPGPSAALDWWPAEGTPLEADWSRETLAVVGRVWRAEGASLYWRPGTEALRDDLQDWLLAEAMEFRDRYVPPDDPQPDELGAWCATLHHVLAQRARWHFSRVMRVGLSPEQTRQAVYSTDSLDRPVDRDGGGHGGRSLPLGEALGELPGMEGSRRQDPLDLLLLAEDLSERVAPLWHGEGLPEGAHLRHRQHADDEPHGHGRHGNPAAFGDERDRNHDERRRLHRDARRRVAQRSGLDVGGWHRRRSVARRPSRADHAGLRDERGDTHGQGDGLLRIWHISGTASADR